MKSEFKIVSLATMNILEKVELMAKDMNKSEHISPLDACTCTGNCGGGGGGNPCM